MLWPSRTMGLSRRRSGVGRRRSLDNGSLLLVPRTTLAQAQKPRLPTKNGSIQDGTILSICRLGNLSVPFRLSPRWRGVDQSVNGFPFGEVATACMRRIYDREFIPSATRITWTGESFSSPVSCVSPRLVPKVAFPNRSTFCIVPARWPVMLIGKPKSKPPYPGTKTRT